MNQENFIIVIAHSEKGIKVRKMTGTRENVQDKVMDIIQKDREKRINYFYDGTKDVYDLDHNGDGNGFRGFNIFYDGISINYAAFPIKDIVSTRKLPKAG